MDKIPKKIKFNDPPHKISVNWGKPPKISVVVASPILERSAAYDYTSPLLHKVTTKIVCDDPKFLPKYQTEGSACVDLMANIPAPISMAPRTIVTIDCGFSMEIKPGYKAVIVARSGFASRGLLVPNGPGQIDSDYRGKVKVILMNAGREIILINPGDRVAQMHIEPVLLFDWVVSTELSETERGTGGFGSTGVK